MTEQLEQLMFHGREIAMTDTEKAAIRHRILAYTLAQPPHASAVAPVSWVRRHAFAAFSLAVLLALGATGVSAHMAGPNDALYNFRLQVNDRIESAITFNNEAQLDVELRQIERQLNAEEKAADEALATQEDQDTQGHILDGSETPEPQKVNMFESMKNNLKAHLGSGRKNNQTNTEVDGDDAPLDVDSEINAELKRVERELQNEESTQIGHEAEQED